MAFEFIGFGRDQVFLLAPSLREWVPEGHLVWTVLDAVGEMDLGAFYGDYRADGHGRPAYEPAMTVGLLIYATRVGIVPRAGSSGLALEMSRTSSIRSGSSPAPKGARRGFARAAALDEQREREARPVTRSRTDRLFEAARRLEEELEVEHQANGAYEAYRARGVMTDGRRFGAPPKPHQPPEMPAGRINTTDHDSRLMKTVGPAMQGYNAQAAVNENQIAAGA